LGLIKRGWIWVLAILVVAGVFAAFRLSKKTDPDYFTAILEKGDIRQVIEATGTINPVTSVQVGSQVSGMISKLYVDFNSKVTKGQIIAEIDPKLFQGAVLQAQADLQNAQALLAAAKANLAKDQATLQQNRLDYDRAVGLQRQGVNSQQQLDQAKATYDAITAQVGSDRAAIQQAEAQVAQKAATLKVAQTNLHYTIIRAPINGTVVARNIDIGQTVAASLQAPTLFMIALDLTKMQVYAKTDEGDVGQIRPGQKADFQVDAFPKEMFHGVVFQVRMNATSIQNVVTYDTIVNFDNPDLKLFPGMTAYVSIPVASVSDTVKIPNAALRYKPDLSSRKGTGTLQQVRNPCCPFHTNSSCRWATGCHWQRARSSQTQQCRQLWRRSRLEASAGQIVAAYPDSYRTDGSHLHSVDRRRSSARRRTGDGRNYGKAGVRRARPHSAAALGSYGNCEFGYDDKCGRCRSQHAARRSS
jgi:HlyD family secretion protein